MAPVQQPPSPQISGFPAPPPPPPSTYRPYYLVSADTDVVKRFVARSLKDPYSAVFGEIVASMSDKGVVSVCGTVNGKNSYGAYIGQTPFVGVLATNTSGQRVFAVSGIGGTAEESLIVRTLCQRQGMNV